MKLLAYCGLTSPPPAPEIFILTFTYIVWNRFNIRLDNVSSSFILKDEVTTYETRGDFSPEEGMGLDRGHTI